MEKKFYFTKHALIEMADDDIGLQDVKAVALDGEILKKYPDDRKGPSQLMLGIIDKRPVHVVCAHQGEEIHIITAYRPSPSLWKTDFRTRKISQTMTCSICNNGNCTESVTEELFNRKGKLIILKNLPAMICENCGAKFFTEQTSQLILENLKEAESSRAELEIITAKVA